MMNSTLAELCAVYGIVWEYLDGESQPKHVPKETCIAILNALGLDISGIADMERRRHKMAATIKGTIRRSGGD